MRDMRFAREASLALGFALALSACGSSGDGTPAKVTRRSLVEKADCNTSGHACTWAGLPGPEEAGFNGDGKHRLDSRLYWTMDMFFASNGDRWLIDWNNHLVRRVRSDDTLETIVGWTDPVFPGDGAPDETMPAGTLGTNVKLNHPTDMAEKDGQILLMAWHNHKLRSIDPATKMVKIAAGAGVGFRGDGAALNSGQVLFKQPRALEVDAAGNIYILDQGNFRIRKVGTDGMINTIAGGAMAGFEGDGGPAAMAKFGFEAGSNPEPSGGLAIKDDKLYIADTLNHRIRMIDLTTNMISTIAGTGTGGFSGDGGPAASAQVNHPEDIEIYEGKLYIADTDNSRIRAIDLTAGTIDTVAGTGELGLDEEEGLLAKDTALWRPFGIEFDRDGNLYVSDTLNSRILRVAK